jgi:hypothetical protein
MMQPVGDYTNRDYSALVESLLDVAAMRLPEWTDRSENDLGRVLLELFAYVGDTILYYQDRIAAEAFLATAVERRSVIDLVELLGYRLATASPAAVDLLVTPRDPAVQIRIDAGARFATEAAEDRPAVEFAFLPVGGAAIDQMPTTLPSGAAAPIPLTALNAVPVEGQLGQATGQANFLVTLPQPGVLLAPDPALPDGFVVEVRGAAGWEQWERRTTLLHSRGTDPHYVVRVDENDVADVLFGDGTYGRIPPGGADIRARYRVGGGAQGNVGPGTVNVIVSGVSVPATVTNPLGASGGSDREAIEHARRHAPEVYRSQHRAVTEDDFVALAESFPGIARARAVGTAWNYVDVLVVAEGSLVLPDALRTALLGFFESRRMVSTLVNIREPVFVSVDATVKVGVDPRFYAADVAARARAAIDRLFALDVVDFGRSFNVSKLFEAVEALDGVAFAEVTGLQGRRSRPAGELVDPAAAAAGRIPVRAREFLRRGAIAVTTEGGVQ